MTTVILQYDTSLTGTLTQSVTAQAVNIWCEMIPESVSEFTTVEHTNLQSVIGRYNVNIVFSLTNFENDNAMYIAVQRWIAAPVKSFHTKGVTDINGYTSFSASNTYYWNIDSQSTNWMSNRKYRTLSVSIVSEKKYTF
jgi:hypothetical protein